MEDGIDKAFGTPIVHPDKLSDYLILEQEIHQLERASWTRGMPEEHKCKCSGCRVTFERERSSLECSRENLEAGYISTSEQLERHMSHSEKLLEVLYAFPPKVPKKQAQSFFNWEAMRW